MKFSGHTPSKGDRSEMIVFPSIPDHGTDEPFAMNFDFQCSKYVDENNDFDNDSQFFSTISNTFSIYPILHLNQYRAHNFLSRTIGSSSLS